MILIENNNVKISGNEDVVLTNLIALELTILMDDDLQNLRIKAIDEAIRIYKSGEHDVEIRSFKTPGKTLYKDNNR